jgi:hypothetical protein
MFLSSLKATNPKQQRQIFEDAEEEFKTRKSSDKSHPLKQCSRFSYYFCL